MFVLLGSGGTPKGHPVGALLGGTSWGKGQGKTYKSLPIEQFVPKNKFHPTYQFVLAVPA